MGKAKARERINKLFSDERFCEDKCKINALLDGRSGSKKSTKNKTTTNKQQQQQQQKLHELTINKKKKKRRKKEEVFLTNSHNISGEKKYLITLRRSLYTKLEQTL